jgi:hypothetical protein
MPMTPQEKMHSGEEAAPLSFSSMRRALISADPCRLDFTSAGLRPMFHVGYKYSKSLIRLGRFDGSYEPLLTRGKFSLHIELIP